MRLQDLDRVNELAGKYLRLDKILKSPDISLAFSCDVAVYEVKDAAELVSHWAYVA